MLNKIKRLLFLDFLIYKLNYEKFIKKLYPNLMIIYIIIIHYLL